jgi:hypothetical protein
MRIDEGHYGDTALDGLLWSALFAWPGAIHEGNGEALIILDEHADAEQQAALLSILSGASSEPGATVFNVFASTLSKLHDPVQASIAFELDESNWTGHFSVPGYIDANASPIANPITGETHRARVMLPEGFEYREAEFVSSHTHADGPIPLDWADGHGHIAMIHMTASGPVN